jgi:rhomboid protease GluP
MFDADHMVEEAGMALVGEFLTIQEANEYALVVLAMNLDCWIRLEADPTRYTLYSDPAFGVAIREEFTLYASEQVAPAEKVELPLFRSGLELAFLWIVVLVLAFISQNNDASIAERYRNSSLALFDQGEWWRPFTALFLHGDFNHLIGNVALGGIFCILVAYSVGPLLGWALILASGMIGNVLTAFYHYPEPFLSLGASTATFGALGILSGVGGYTVWRSRSYRKLAGVLIPLVAGGIMLGWWGAGGAQTDVLAHVMGFAVGAVLGAPVAWWQMRRPASGGLATA